MLQSVLQGSYFFYILLWRKQSQIVIWTFQFRQEFQAVLLPYHIKFILYTIWLSFIEPLFKYNINIIVLPFLVKRKLRDWKRSYWKRKKKTIVTPWPAVKISWLTCPSRGARKLRHSFSITGTWMVCESPWVQKHRNFWEGSIKRLLAQNDDKKLAAILFSLFVWNDWPETLRIQARLLSKWRQLERSSWIQSKDWKRSTKPGNTITPRFAIKPYFFNCSEGIVIAVVKTVISKQDLLEIMLNVHVPMNSHLLHA